jgi:hypothetical protein
MHLPTAGPEHLRLPRLAGTWRIEDACAAVPGKDPALRAGIERHHDVIAPRGEGVWRPGSCAQGADGD